MSGKPSITQLQYPNKRGTTVKIALFSIVVIALIVGVVYVLTKPGGALSPYWVFLKGDRFGGDLEKQCGKYTTQKDLQAQCEKEPKCLGYTLKNTFDPISDEMYWKPWCMKTTSSKPFTEQDDHKFFIKPKLG